MVIIKQKATKLFVSTLLIALLCSPFVSMAFAASEDNNTQAAREPRSPVSSGDQIDDTSQDNAMTTSEGNPVLVQERDNGTTTGNDDSTISPTEGSQEEDEPNLIATQDNPDNTTVIGAAIALAVTIAIGVTVAIVRRREK